MKLNILGTEYDYFEVAEHNEKLKSSSGGICCFHEKYIAINKEIEGEDIERIKRHEILHALFKESGLAEYSSDEILIDFLSFQFPKFVAIYNEVKNESM